MTAPSVRHREVHVGDKCATGVPNTKKIRCRENISVGTWNVRTLRPAGKFEQLTHAIGRYQWNIVVRDALETTDDGHELYFSGEMDRHEYGVGFLVHKDIASAVLGCRSVSSKPGSSSFHSRERQ